MDEHEESKLIYSIGENIIWLKQTCITGKKFYFMIIAFLSYTVNYVVVVVILVANFKKKKVDKSLFLFSIIFMSVLYIIEIFANFRAGFTEPGILPKQYTSYIPHKKQERKCVIRGHLFNIKYCLTCDIFRPPRSSHCSKCDNCVQKFDHHCMWIGTDVGIRNYKFFYLLVFSINLNNIYQIGFCLYFLIVYNINEKNENNTIDYKIIIPMSLVVLYNILIIILLLGKLFCVHSFLCCSNLTFYEYFKKKFKKVPGFNPFKRNFFYNWRQNFLNCARKTIFFDRPIVNFGVKILNNNNNGKDIEYLYDKLNSNVKKNKTLDDTEDRN